MAHMLVWAALAWHSLGAAADTTEAEALLAHGRASDALVLFEHAATTEHSPEIEAGIVRSHMQLGEYRRALALAAHTAGDHRDAPGATALYAWLLRLGGQADYARTVLAAAADPAGSDAGLAAMRVVEHEPQPQVPSALLALPYRAAPYDAADRDIGAPTRTTGIPSDARRCGTGWLLDGGRRALVPIASVQAGHSLWLRNGLGQSRAAIVERRLEGLGLAVTRLEVPMTIPQGRPSSTDSPPPWAGSPGYAIDFATGHGAGPEWPWLHLGFFGDTTATDGRHSGIAHGEDGAVIFDASGRWVGMAPSTRGSGARGDRWVTASALRAVLPDAYFSARTDLDSRAATPASTAGARLTPDAVYDHAIAGVLQVLIASTSGKD